MIFVNIDVVGSSVVLMKDGCKLHSMSVNFLASSAEEADHFLKVNLIDLLAADNIHPYSDSCQKDITNTIDLVAIRPHIRAEIQTEAARAFRNALNPEYPQGYQKSLWYNLIQEGGFNINIDIHKE